MNIKLRPSVHYTQPHSYYMIVPDSISIGMERGAYVCACVCVCGKGVALHVHALYYVFYRIHALYPACVQYIHCITYILMWLFRIK